MTDEDFVGDDIGRWSVIKLEIIEKYASAYSSILHGQRRFKHIYIDGYAGSGESRLKETGERIPGSPERALAVAPPFYEYHFVDLDPARANRLQRLREGRSNVFVYEGDANEELIRIFARIEYKDFKRAFCLMDPHKMQWRWEVVQAAATTKTIDLLLHFPIMAMNRGILRRDPSEISEQQIQAMNMLWGDESWREVAYRRDLGLWQEFETKRTSDDLAAAFRTRLKNVAGFGYVTKPILMLNSNNAPLYYLYLASHNETAVRVMSDIFKKYRGKGWAK